MHTGFPSSSALRRRKKFHGDRSGSRQVAYQCSACPPPRGVLMFPGGRGTWPTAPQATQGPSLPEHSVVWIRGRGPALAVISQAKMPPAYPDCWLQMSPSLSPRSQQATVGNCLAWAQTARSRRYNCPQAAWCPGRSPGPGAGGVQWGGLISQQGVCHLPGDTPACDRERKDSEPLQCQVAGTGPVCKFLFLPGPPA